MGAWTPDPIRRGPEERPGDPGAAGRDLASLALGRTLGLAGLLLGQLQYVSWSSRVVFGRWSIPAAVAIGIVSLALLASAGDSLVRWRRRVRSGAGPVAERVARRPSIAVDRAAREARELGWLCLGLAYLIAALADPDAGGRLLELDLFGSFHPASILLGWCALVAFGAAAALVGWRRLRPRAPGAYLLLVSLGLVFLVGEGVTRAVNVLFPMTQGFPTASGELWMRRFGRLNSLGFRDAEHAREKPADTYRILMVGDSFTFGVGVDDPAERASERLAHDLPERLARPVEVVNAGVPYTHTLQQLETLESLLDWSPDLVLLVYVFNDIDYLRASARPSTALADGGSPLGRIHPMRLAYLNSFLVQQVYLRLRHAWWRLAPDADRPTSAYADPALVERHLDDLRRFVERAGSTGAAVAIAPFNPDFAQTTPTHAPLIAFLERARSEGLPVWPLEHAFDGADYARLIVNSMDHHPSGEANRLFAQALARAIETAALPRAANVEARP